MNEAPWRRRFRAARVTLPAWARDNADRLLYGSTQTGKLELYAWDRKTGVKRQVSDRPQGTARGLVAPAGDAVWWFDDESGSERGVWMREGFDSGGAERAAPIGPAYSAGVAVGTRVKAIGTSDDSGTRLSVVADSGVRTVYQHREYAQLVGLSRDERLLAIEHSEHGDSRHPAVRVIDVDGATVVDLWDGPGRGLAAGEWSPLEDEHALIVTHERGGQPRPGLWREGEQDLTELDVSLPGEVDASWYPDGRRLLLQHEHEGRSELFAYDLESGHLERLPSEPGTIDAARVRPDGDVWYSWSSSSQPPSVLSLHHGSVLAAPGEAAPPGIAYQDVRAGEVHCFLAEPPGSRPHPAILLIHGGPAAHDRDSFAPRVQAWVDHGFAVLLVNYRGSTGYGERWRDALQGNPGLTELEDIAAARNLVVARGIADPDRLILAGRSWGGYLTLLGLGTRPELWSLGIADVPVADYFAAFEDEMEPLKAFDRALFGGTPEERPEFYRVRSPLTYVDRVRVPVYMSGGENDPRCPIRQIHNYAGALKARAKPHQLYLYEAGHASMVVDEQIRQLEAQLAFASRHLGTQAPI